MKIKIDYNPKMLGYFLLVLAFFFAIAKMGQRGSAQKFNEADKAYKSNRDNAPEKVVLKPFPVDCPKGSSKLPDSEIKKFSSSAYDGGIARNGYGQWYVQIQNKSDWDIDLIQVWFEMDYVNGTTSQTILVKKGTEVLDRLIFFEVSNEDKIKYFTDVKKFRFRVVYACGKIRPMKIEIKAKEALKEAEESMNKVIKEINDLFSR